MRRLLIPGLALSFTAMAYPAATRPIDPARASAEVAQLEQRAIVIREQSNVCVSVHVDQRVWPAPLTEDSARNFSGHLMAELRRLYGQSGGSTVIPGPGQEPRFVTDEHGSNPLCRQAEDIRIKVRYRPRREGGPFDADYLIEQGTAVRSRTFSRDLMGEISSGRLRISNIDTIASPIADDIRSRAETIFREIN
jgi:hypothetical protein